MLAVVISRNGGPEVLEPREWPEPAPGEGQLLVALEAAGVNFRDVYERRGGYGTPPPLVAGAEGAGSVVAARRGRDRVRGRRPGELDERDRQLRRARARRRRPRGAGAGRQSRSELAAAVLLQGMTAHYLATSTHPDPPPATTCSCMPPPGASGCS